MGSKGSGACVILLFAVCCVLCLMTMYSELSKKELIALLERYDANSPSPVNDVTGMLASCSPLSLLQTVLDTVDEPIYIVNLSSHIIVLANKKTEQLFGPVVGHRCWEKLQNGQMSVCGFCTNSLLLDSNNHATGVHQSLYENTLTNKWYQCSDQAFKWLDGEMVAIKTSVDVNNLKEATAALDTLLKKNKSITQELVLLIESERRKLSRDLHDEVGQIATAIKLNASFLAASQNTTSSQHLAASTDIEQLATRLLKTVSGVSKRLNPRDYIALLNVPDMLQALFDDWANRNPNINSNITFTTAVDINIATDLKETLYRLCQEALTNISKHAQASQVEVFYQLSKDGTEDRSDAYLIELQISDNGVGLSTSSHRNSLGLKYMGERVELHGGRLSIERCAHLGGAKVFASFLYLDKGNGENG